MRFAICLLAASLSFAQRNVPIDNEFARVLVVTDAPNRGKGQLHEHTMNRVMVYLDEGSQRITYDDGRMVNLKFKSGDVFWSPASGKHQSENTGGKPTRIIEIELKNTPKPFTPPPLDPIRAKLPQYMVEFDNPQVRVFRANIPPHGKIVRHEHPLNRVTIYLKPQLSRITVDGQAPMDVPAPAVNEVRFGKPVIHAEENLADAPIEGLVVEFK